MAYDRPLDHRVRGPDRGAGSSTAPSAASSRSPAPSAKAFLNGQVTNDVEALAPGHGLLRGVPDPQGQDARRPARARHRRASCCSTPSASRSRRSSTCMRRGAVGYEAELHKRTLQRGLLSLVGPRGARRSPARRACRREEHANAAGELGGAAGPRSSPPTSGVDVVCAAEDAARVRDALLAAGAVPVDEAAAEVAARRVRPPALRRRPRRLRRSPRRPASTSAPSASPRAATSARRPSPACTTRASPTATCAACGSRRPRAPGAALRSASARSARVGERGRLPALGPIALALVRREAEPGATGSRSAGPRRRQRRGRRAAVLRRRRRPRR